MKQYFTLWSLIFSYTIFTICILFKNLIPLWLLLSAACILTSASIVGTFYIQIPSIDPDEYNNEKKIIADAVVHLGPLILLLLLFSFLVKRSKKPTSNNFLKNFKGKKCKPLDSNYFLLSLIPALILSIVYISVIDPDETYKDFSLRILFLFAVFCSSYQIYFNWSQLNE